MRTALLALSLLAGCKGKVVEKVVEKTVMVVDKDLMLASCLLGLMPPPSGSANSGIAVIQTADGKRYPWIIRHWQFLTAEELEKSMHWMTMGDSMITTMFPSSFCKLTGPAYATFRIGPPGGPTQIWAGKIGALVKDKVDGTLTRDSQDRGVALVIEAIKKDGGANPELAFLPESKDVKSPSVSGDWVEGFRQAAAK